MLDCVVISNSEADFIDNDKKFFISTLKKASNHQFLDADIKVMCPGELWDDTKCDLLIYTFNCKDGNTTNFNVDTFNKLVNKKLPLIIMPIMFNENCDLITLEQQCSKDNILFYPIKVPRMLNGAFIMGSDPMKDYDTHKGSFFEFINKVKIEVRNEYFEKQEQRAQTKVVLPKINPVLIAGGIGAGVGSLIVVCGTSLTRREYLKEPIANFFSNQTASVGAFFCKVVVPIVIIAGVCALAYALIAPKASSRD